MRPNHSIPQATVIPDVAPEEWGGTSLPNELAGPTGEAMGQGTNVVKQTLEARAVQSGIEDARGS